MVRYRWAVLMVLASVLILVASVTGNIVYTRSVESEADQKARRAHQQQVATCLSSNEARAKNIQLWEFVFKLTATPEQTPEQKARVAKFRAYLYDTFAPRDCSKI